MVTEAGFEPHGLAAARSRLGRRLLPGVRCKTAFRTPIVYTTIGWESSKKGCLTVTASSCYSKIGSAVRKRYVRKGDYL